MTDVPGRTVQELVADFASKDPVARQHARDSLVRIGSEAVPALLKALDSPLQHIRWEAAKSLVEIRDPAAAERLIRALSDTDLDVRWVAGEALIALGTAGVRPLLEALLDSDPPEGLYQGAHHVFHDLAAARTDLADTLIPVVKALAGPEPDMAVPLAAGQALKHFRK